ncbi:MAG: HAD-IA family hydrolase [Acetatifactor sp.]|nr:HAD-IA family hydrolase [Acetatifactor sp.]
MLIDMYGVIMEESKGKFIPYTLAHFPEAEHQRLIRAFREEQLFTRAGNGEMSSEDFLRELGYMSPVETLQNYLEQYLTLDAGFKPFAERLRKRPDKKGYDFVLLSNDVAEWNAYLMELHGLNVYFEDVIVSGQVHMRKPQESIFRYTLDRLGCSAGECVFVDNSAANLRAAEKLGIQTVHFNRDGEDYEGCQVENFRELAETLEEH